MKSLTNLSTTNMRQPQNKEGSGRKQIIILKLQCCLLRETSKYHLITPAWQCAKSCRTTQITNQSGINITYDHLIGLLFIYISVDLYLLSIWQITAN